MGLGRGCRAGVKRGNVSFLCVGGEGIGVYIPTHCVFGGRGGIGMLRSGCSRARGSWRRGPLRT